MSRMQLTTIERTDFRKSVTKQLRRDGHIPATMYGRELEPMSLALPAEELGVILKTPGGRLSIIDIKVEGAKSKKATTVMIQDLQRDPITKGIVHVDLHVVRMDEMVHNRVPVQLIGEAPGVKLGGILEHVVREIEIQAYPEAMPTHLVVDISHLNMGDSIHVSEVTLPEGAEILHTSSEGVVATVRLPIVRTEEVVETAEAPAAEATETAAE